MLSVVSPTAWNCSYESYPCTCCSGGGAEGLSRSRGHLCMRTMATAGPYKVKSAADVGLCVRPGRGSGAGHCVAPRARPAVCSRRLGSSAGT